MALMVRMALMVLFVLAFCRMGWAQEKIVIEGTGDSQKLLRCLAEAFQKENPGRSVEIPESIGSSGGVKALIDGRCALARTARPLKDTEKEAGVRDKIFATTPVVFVASGNVRGVQNLTSEQVVAVFSGALSSWAPLGGGDRPLFVASREKGDSSRRVIEAHLPAFRDISSMAGEALYTTPSLMVIFQEHEDVLGYAPLSMVYDVGLVVLALDGVFPSPENVVRGTYEMVVPLAVAWKGELNGPKREFVDFLSSPAAAAIMRSCGAVAAGGNGSS